MSWALSCLSFKRYYTEIELYTDDAGKEWLIDKLGLPYTKVHNCLDKINRLPAVLWAASKIYTYCLQKNSFIHADSDVYIWKKLSIPADANLLAQSIEVNYEFYNGLLQLLKQYHFQTPDALNKAYQVNPDLRTINMGIFGGTDLKFIHWYCGQLYRFYYWNKEKFLIGDMGKLNVLDQFYFYQLTLERQKKIDLELPGVEDFTTLMLFNLVPEEAQYVHLLGAAKKNESYCRMVALHLRYQFPEYYDHIDKLYEHRRPMKLKPETIELSVSFRQTYSILEHFLTDFDSLKLKRYDALLKQVDLLYLSVANNEIRRVLTDVISFEKCRYQLSLQEENMPDEKEQFKTFEKAKRLLAAASADKMDKLMQTPLSAAAFISTIVLETDVLALITDPEWISKLAKAIFPNKGQCIFLFVKYTDAIITSTALGDINQLLYYYGQGAVTGMDLLQHLSEDDEAGEDALNNYKKMIFYFLSNNLVTTGYLTIAG